MIKLNPVSWFLGAVFLAICGLRLWERTAITKQADWGDVIMVYETAGRAPSIVRLRDHQHKAVF